MRTLSVQENSRKKKEKGKKARQLAIFPLVSMEHIYTDEHLTCKDCGTKKKYIFKEIHQYLSFIPAHFETIEEVVHVYSCPKCCAIERAPKKPSLLKGSIATSALVAKVMEDKFIHQITLYQQSQQFRHYNVDVAVRTMANWIYRCCEDYLYPLYERLRDFMVKSNYLYRFKKNIQLKVGKKDLAVVNDKIWIYTNIGKEGHKPIMLLYYDAYKTQTKSKSFLKGFHGTLRDGAITADHLGWNQKLQEHLIRKKEWFFGQSVKSAEASTIIYSLLETAMLNNIKTYDYLVYVMETMREHQYDTDYSFIDKLLPWSDSIPIECKEPQIYQNSENYMQTSG